MVKRYKTILSILLVVLMASGVVLFTGILDINKIVTEKEIKDNPELSQDFGDYFRTVSDMNVPLLSTDIPGVLYSMDKKGDVKFYTAKDNEIKEIKETGSFDTKVECSGQTLPVTIHYLEKSKHTIGYGLFTNLEHENVYIYDYAFFKVSDIFKTLDGGKGTLLMMADVDKSRFYSEDKVYSEIFYLYSDHTTEYMLSENQRTVDLDAKMRTDYKMFTNDIDDQTQDNLLFFSSRFYTGYDEYTAIDIMSSGGTGENIDNLRYVQDVLSLNFWRTDKGVYYFKEDKTTETDENGEAVQSFSLWFFDGNADTVVHQFFGNFEEDYIIDGDYMLNCQSGEIYSILNDSYKGIDYSEMKKGFKPDLFEISDNGNYAVVRGSNTRNHPAIIVIDFVNNKQYDYTNDVFGFISTVNVTNDGTVVLSIASSSEGASYYQLVTYNKTEEATTAADTTAEETKETVTDEPED